MDPGQVPAPTKQRLFLTLWPDDDVRGQLLAHAGQWRWPAGCVNYVQADFHATLHFIGPVAAGQVEHLAACADVPFQPFEWVLDQPMLWPHGLAVLGARNIPDSLQTLHDRLGEVLRQLGLPVESRAYRPHVTLARHAGAATLPEACVPLVWRVNGVALVVSTGQKEGRYRVFRQYR